MNEVKNIEEKLGDFDPLVVHYRDERTGKVVRSNTYRVIVDRGTSFYEWPKSSGNLYFQNRVPAGRLSEKGEVIRGEKHEIWTAPVTDDMKIGQENAALKQENKRILAELAEIQKENELSTTHPKAEVKKKVEAKSSATVKA